MTEKNEKESESAEMRSEPSLVELLKEKEIRDFLEKILEKISGYFRIQESIKVQVANRVFILLALIICVVGFLGFFGKISSDSVTFLVGALVGYLFTFLHKYVLRGPG